MKNAWKALRILLGLALLVSGVVGIGTAINNMSLEKETQEQQEQSMVDTLKVDYDKLEVGMSYDDCVSILGVEVNSLAKQSPNISAKQRFTFGSPMRTQFLSALKPISPMES